MTEDWQKVLDLQKAGDVVEGTIKALNRSVPLLLLPLCFGVQCDHGAP